MKYCVVMVFPEKLQKYRLIGIFVIFFLFQMTNYIHAQSRYNVIFDPQKGQYYAGENFNAFFHLYDFADSIVVPKKILKNNKAFAKVINPVFRFTKFLLSNYLVTDYMMTQNHERFGHGYRILEADGEIIRIKYNVPPPFGKDQSYIRYRSNDITRYQKGMIKLGGHETNLVFSDIIRKNFLLDESFNYTYAMPYLYGSNDAPGYTLFGPTRGDPRNYSNNLEEMYGYDLYASNKMKVYSWIAMLTDPINFYAFKSLIYDYFIRGRHSTKVGMIKFNNRLKYLPRFRFEYTPYGPELVYQNYFKLGSKLIQLSFSHSDVELPKSWRITANFWNQKLTKNIMIDFSGQLWNQPLIEYFDNDEMITSEGLGGQFSSTIFYAANINKHIWKFTIQVAYKTRGYTLGEQLNEGLIIRGGLSFKCRYKKSVDEK